MHIFFCETCEKIFSDEDLRQGVIEKKKGKITCQSCLNPKSMEEGYFTCHCNRKHSINALLNGEAILITDKNGKKGQIYCKKCRHHGERKSRESLDIKYLIAIFIVFLGIPLMIGTGISLNRYLQENKSSQDELGSGRELVDEMRQTFQDEINRLRKEMSQVQKEGKTLPENNSTPINSSLNKKKEELSFVEKNPGKTKSLEQKKEVPNKKFSQSSLSQMLQEISQKSILSIEKNILSSSLEEKLKAFSQIALYREQAAIPLLEKTLDDSDPFIRSLAIKTLGVLGARQSVNRLFSMTSDPDPQVRKSAAAVLTLLTREKFILYEDLSEKDWEILERFRNK